MYSGAVTVVVIMYFDYIQIPPSPLAAGPPGMPSGMGPGFPPTEPGMPPGVQMYKPSHAPMPNGIPSHHSQQGNLMQAGPPEPFQVFSLVGDQYSWELSSTCNCGYK